MQPFRLMIPVVIFELVNDYLSHDSLASAGKTFSIICKLAFPRPVEEVTASHRQTG